MLYLGERLAIQKRSRSTIVSRSAHVSITDTVKAFSP